MTQARDALGAMLVRFPGLSSLDAEGAALFARSARAAVLPAGTKVFEAGAPCRDFLMIAEGRVRVQQVSAEGREIVLYRVGAGESCILTTACLLAHEDYAAEAVAETEVGGILLSREGFNRLLAGSARFRDLVFAGFARRLADLMHLVEEVAFGHVDTRLAERLLALAGAGDAVHHTHQELAIELGTAREVVSRQLKEFERRGHVDLERGRIALRDRAALAALAARQPV